MRVGVCDWVLGKSNDADAFALAKTVGFAGVEVNLRCDELRSGNTARIDSLKRLMETTGLPVCSTCLGEHNNNGLVAAPGRREQAVAEIRAAIDFSHALNAKALLVPFFFFNEPRNVRQRDQIASALAPLAAYAADHDVALTYEGTLSPDELQAMARQINSPAFGYYFDLGNVVWLGRDGPADIRALGPLVKRVHLKDTRLGPGDCSLGAGIADFADSARALHEIGYDDWIISESGGPSDQLKADLAFAKKTFRDNGYPEI